MNKFNFKNGYLKYFRLAWENILYPGKFKIDFVVVGAQKAGTTSLDKYLREQPNITMPKWKEICYFDNDIAFKTNRLPNLRGFYTIKNRLKIYGECTPCYIYWDTAIKRIKEHNPDAKIVAILRNPVTRAFSQWNMEVWRNAETRNFKTCIKEEIWEIEKGIKEQHRVNSYVHRGMYVEQIERIYSEFPRKQVLFVKYEDFLKQQLSVLNRIFIFIGGTPFKEIPERKNANKRKYSVEMTKEEKKLLLDFFDPTIKKVENMLSWDCSDWRK
jgi:hypothetical protein